MHLILEQANLVFVLGVQKGASSSSSASGFFQLALAPSASTAKVPSSVGEIFRGSCKQFLADGFVHLYNLSSDV